MLFEFGKELKQPFTIRLHLFTPIKRFDVR